MQIIVMVTPTGKAETIVKGRAGPSCTSDSKFLTDALGIITSDIKTEEYDGIQLVTDNVEQQQQIQHVRRSN